MRKLQFIDIKPYTMQTRFPHAIYYRRRFFIKDVFSRENYRYENNDPNIKIKFYFQNFLTNNKKVMYLIDIMYYNFYDLSEGAYYGNPKKYIQR